MMKKNFYSQLTPYKLLQLLIQIIGFSLFLLVFFGLAHRSDNTEKIVSAEGLQELTTQPPSKDGGFRLRAESPDTHRLNDASHYGSTLKLSC